MSRNWIETLVGALVLGVAAFFLYTLIGRADVGQGGGNTYTASFLNAEGLSVGTDVRISGVKVGRITGQELDKVTFDAQVSFTIDGDLEVPADSSIKVLSDGLLGGSFLSLEPGGDEEVLADGGHIKYTSDAVNLIDLISKAIFSSAEN